MRKNKVISLLLTGVLMGSVLVGCGQKSEVDSAKVDEEVIKVGTNFAMTGGAASYGQGSLKNIRLAIDEINAAGGVLGKKLVIVEGDNKSEPTEAAAVTRRLINQEKVVAIIGTAVSSAAIASAPITSEAKIPMIAPSATASGVTVDPNGKVFPFMFRTCMINPFQGGVGAKFAINTLGVKKAAILIDNSTDYSKDLTKEFEKAFTEMGGEIILKEGYLAQEKDFRAVLTKIRQANPEVIYLPGYYNEAALIIKQARELGITVPFVGGDAWDSPALVEIAGAKALENTYFTNHYSTQSDNEKSKSFVESYKAKYNENPDAIGAMAYDATYLLADAITRAGVVDSVKIQEALQATDGFKGISGTITFDEFHNPVKSAFMIQYVNGEQKLMTVVEPN